MANLLLQYLNALDRLCRIAGTVSSAHLGNMCLDNLSDNQLIEGAMLFEYHCRRLLAEKARKETEQMIDAMRNGYWYDADYSSLLLIPPSKDPKAPAHKRMRKDDP